MTDISENDLEPTDQEPQVHGFDPTTLEEDDAPEEVEQAVLELGRLQQEVDRVSPSDSGSSPAWPSSPPRDHVAPSSFDAPFPMSSQGYGEPSPPPPVRQVSADPFMSTREARTLEDLYEQYPQIGGGEYYLRIERKDPKKWGGMLTAGHLEDLHEQITMRDFADRYGGGNYDVTVRGPGRNGGFASRVLSSIRVTVPGAPKLTGREPDARSGANGGHMGGGSAEIVRMRLEAEERERQERREDQLRRDAMRASMPDVNILRHLDQTAESARTSERQANQQVIVTLREQLKSSQEAQRQGDLRVRGLEEELFKVRQEATRRFNEQESDALRQLREQKETELRTLKDVHAERFQEMQRQHDQRVKDLEGTYYRERQSLIENESRERERLRDDINRRESEMRREHERAEKDWKERERMLREEFQRREEQAHREHRQRLQDLESSFKRDIEYIRSGESSKVEFANQSANLQISLLQADVQRARESERDAEQQAAGLQQELNVLRTPKPLPEQVREIKEMSTLLGLDKEKEEPFDWKKGIFTVVSKGMESLPKAVDRVLSQRENMVAQQAHAQALAQAQVAAAQGRLQLPAAPMMPPSMTAQQSAAQQPSSSPRRDPDPPPGWGDSVAEFSGPPISGAASDRPPNHAPRSSSMADDFWSAPPLPEEAKQVVQTQDDLWRAPPVKKTTEQASETPPQEGSAQTTPSAPQPGHSLSFTEEHFNEFIANLVIAIDTDMVTPDQFAQGFIDRVGPQAAGQALELLSPEQIMQSASQAEDAQAKTIVTRRGRKFLAALWESVARRLRGEA